MNVNANLDLILRRYQELGARLSAGVSGAEYAKASKELSDLEPLAASIQTLRLKESEHAGLVAMVNDPDLDSEMKEMAEEELKDAEAEVIFTSVGRKKLLLRMAPIKRA